jgi:hypothetical protein
MKAERINGIVYMPSPVRVKHHGEPTAHIQTWLGVYTAATPGVETANDSTIHLGGDHDVQPDDLLKSRAFPGLHLDARAHLAAVLEAVRRGDGRARRLRPSPQATLLALTATRYSKLATRNSSIE